MTPRHPTDLTPTFDEARLPGDEPPPPILTGTVLMIVFVLAFWKLAEIFIDVATYLETR